MNITQTRSNIVLIGMPGAGKSTVGVILAKQTLRDFVDTDVLIQAMQGRTLQDIVDTDGYAVLRKIEEDVLRGLSVQNCVIATGGSAVYSDSAMSHLKSGGIVVFLDVDLPTLTSRIHNFSTRGLAKSPDQNFADMFHERLALYTRYSDITVTYAAGLTHEDVCARILSRVRDEN
jgi:shikimate kinase